MLRHVRSFSGLASRIGISTSTIPSRRRATLELQCCQGDTPASALPFHAFLQHHGQGGHQLAERKVERMVDRHVPPRAKPLSVTNGLGKEDHDQEGRVITAEYPSFYGGLPVNISAFLFAKLWDLSPLVAILPRKSPAVVNEHRLKFLIRQMNSVVRSCQCVRAQLWRGPEEVGVQGWLLGRCLC